MLCANFGYFQRGWPPCQECWNGDCLSANVDREPYYHGVIEDVECIPWDYNPKDGLMYKQLTNVVHLFMTLIVPTCHFCNLQYRIPTSSANESLFMMHITRCIMDAGWGRKPSTIKNHILEVNINVIKCKEIGKVP